MDWRCTDRPVRRTDLTVATADHNVPTININQPIVDPISAKQVSDADEELRANSAFGSTRWVIPGQGIVHVIGPEQGLTLPGMTVVCGDSHTSTHGAFGALAFGIGTSEVEHVLATQTLPQMRPKTMAITVDGELPARVRPRKTSSWRSSARSAPAAGSVRSSSIADLLFVNLSMEGRMTICNMSIEAGAKAGMIAPDDTTFAYIEGRQYAPKGKLWEAALDYWRSLPTDEGRRVRPRSRSRCRQDHPHVSWGTNPGQVGPIDSRVPDPERIDDPPAARCRRARALPTWTSVPGTPMRDIPVDTVFIGSCTNSRIEDLRLAASVVRGKSWRPECGPMVVPGSMRVKAQAEARRTRSHLSGSRIRMALGGLLHVSGYESGSTRTGSALRVDQQSQFRRTPGQGRAHASGFARRCGGNGHHGAFSPRPRI